MNRNLTWKISRVIGATDPFSVLNHLPGQQGLDLLIKAFQRAGADESATTNVERAHARLSDLVDLHAGDRDQFELTLESMGLFERERILESGRELAFRGNSMIWGVQTRVRLVSAVVAPSPDSTDKIDFTLLGGLIGFRRLRPTARWRLARAQVYDDQGVNMEQRGPEPFVPDNGVPQAPLLVPDFCSPNMPEIECISGPEGVELILPGGPVGNTAAFDCVMGMIARNLPRFRTLENECGSSAAAVSLPTETLIMDLIIQRELQIGPIEVSVFGFPHGGLDSPAAQNTQNSLPISGALQELAGLPPAVATPLVPRYSQMINRVYERMALTPADFRGWRLTLPHPPMSSKVVLSWKLPQSP